MEERTPAMFWEWFLENEHEYAAIDQPKEWTFLLFTAFECKIKYYNMYLDGKFFRMPDGRMKLTISAEGFEKAFAMAEEIVAAAPALPGWEFVALEEPKDAEYELEKYFPMVKVDIKKIWFILQKPATGIKINVLLCLNGSDYRGIRLLHALARKIVLNVLGERVFAETVESVAGFSLLDEETNWSMTKLEDLGAMLTSRDQGLMIGKDGELKEGQEDDPSQ